MSYFFFFYQSPSSSLCLVFDSISSYIDEILLINPSAKVFVFRDFNVHHRDWLTYSGGTDRPGELCYNFSISNDLAQMLNFRTCILECDSRIPALLDLFISYDASICSTMAFPLLGNSDHVIVSVSMDFLSFRMPRFITLPMTIPMLIGTIFVIVLEMFHGRISLNSVLLLLLVNFVSMFRLELIYISLIEGVRSSLTHFHCFQLLVLLP